MKTSLQNINFLVICICLAITPVILNGQIIHVPGDQPTIQAGINAATTGDTVLVAEGTYVENINYEGKAITVASHFIIDNDPEHIEFTVIDGSEPTDPDIGSVVTFTSGEDTTSVICGFSIINGSGTLYPSFGVRVGGGIVCNFSGCKIVNNYIYNNELYHDGPAMGGGIAVGNYESLGKAVICNNKIYNNYVESTNSPAYGGGMTVNVDSRIENNEIYDNEVFSEYERAFAAGVNLSGYDVAFPEIIFIHNSISNNFVSLGPDSPYAAMGAGLVKINMKGEISHNNISENSAESENISTGAIHIEFCDTTLRFTHNIVSYNYFSNSLEHKGGGVFVQMGGGYVSHNIVFENEATLGGGIYVEESYSESFIVNNTIAYNDADYDGDGIYLHSDAVATIKNNIIWDNDTPSGDGIFAKDGSIYTITYNDIQEDWPGEGNISEEPLYYDYLGFEYDFHLSEDSPCIDTGDPSSPLDPDGSICDMGAYCYDPDYNPLEAISTNSLSNFHSISIYPNPSYGMINLSSENEINTIQVLNFAGCFINEINQKNFEHIQIDLTNYPSGLYFLNVQFSDGGIEMKPVIKL